MISGRLFEKAQDLITSNKRSADNQDLDLITAWSLFRALPPRCERTSASGGRPRAGERARVNNTFELRRDKLLKSIEIRRTLVNFRLLSRQRTIFCEPLNTNDLEGSTRVYRVRSSAL